MSIFDELKGQEQNLAEEEAERKKRKYLNREISFSIKGKNFRLPFRFLFSGLLLSFFVILPLFVLLLSSETPSEEIEPKFQMEISYEGSYLNVGLFSPEAKTYFYLIEIIAPEDGGEFSSPSGWNTFFDVGRGGWMSITGEYHIEAGETKIDYLRLAISSIIDWKISVTICETDSGKKLLGSVSD